MTAAHQSIRQTIAAHAEAAAVKRVQDHATLVANNRLAIK